VLKGRKVRWKDNTWWKQRNYERKIHFSAFVKKKNANIDSIKI
jgi:hypothetical protein